MSADAPVTVAPALDLARAPGARRLSARTPGRVVAAACGAVALVAIAGPGALVLFGPRVHARHDAFASIPRRVVPRSEVPVVEPVAIADLSPDAARAFNVDVPIEPGPNPAARAFRPAATGEDLARAVDCLATAELYEAGDDPPGERAVAQVVLNRVRHPAFPKTVCGVVFQGSERSTGCQFSFTCDGSIARHRLGDDAWARARRLATAALGGAVYRPVGLATHYHADFVVPYWQASLDKLAVVHTQIFYRWSGWWGSPAAFTARAAPGEPVIAALAPVSTAHRVALAAVDSSGAAGVSPPGISPVAGAVAAPATGGIEEGDAILATLPANIDPDLFPYVAHKACVGHARCKFMGWTDRARTPAAMPPTTEQIATMSFSYLLDETAGLDKRLWNCAEFTRRDPGQCMKRQMLFAEPAAPTTARAAQAEPLSGVRRQAAASPATEAARPGATR